MSDDDDVRDRLGMRFETEPEEEDEPDDEDETEPEPESNPDPSPEVDPEPQAPEIAPDVSNIREEWAGFSVHLPQTMHKRVEDEYKRLAYECDWDIQKGRHYYPLIFYYGLELIESTDGDEVKDLVERMNL